MKFLRSFIIFSLVYIVSCQPYGKEKAPEKSLPGNWGFLDPYGNYNEAFFSDTSYVTYNRVYGLMPSFPYKYLNDSLWSTIDKRKEGFAPVAEIKWLDDDRFVIRTEFHADTLERITEAKIHLGNTDPGSDSLLFREAFNIRYEDFLVRRGILTREEIENFKKDSIIPDDVLKNMQGE